MARQDLPRSVTTSFLLRPFFADLLPLFIAGGRRRLGFEDVSSVPPSLLSVPAKMRLEAALARGDKTSNTYLFRALLSAFGKAFYGPVPGRMGLLFAMFAQVWLVGKMTRYMAQPEGRTGEEGWTLVAGYALVYGTYRGLPSADSALRLTVFFQKGS